MKCFIDFRSLRIEFKIDRNVGLYKSFKLIFKVISLAAMTESLSQQTFECNFVVY